MAVQTLGRMNVSNLANHPCQANALILKKNSAQLVL